jgi:hypothetical protein
VCLGTGLAFEVFASKIFPNVRGVG